MLKKILHSIYIVIIFSLSSHCFALSDQNGKIASNNARFNSKRLNKNSQTPFVEGRLTGQLGNQMFVIAAAVSLALDHGAIPTFPDLLTDKTNNIPCNYKYVFYHLNTTPTKSKVQFQYQEPYYHYAPVPYKPNMCLYGYYQSEKYFKHHKNEVLELFKPRVEIQEYLENKHGELLAKDNTVAVHLRFYIDHDPEQKFYIQHGLDYIRKAISLFPSNAIFVVFSNDIKSCKKELAPLECELIFIEDQTHYHDFYLMSMCKHNIICNSSFSWWAAYLNPNPNKIVVAPHDWFTVASGLNYQDVVPEEWICIK